MTEEQVNINPSYSCIEEEEETITLDFSNNTIYQKEEHLLVKTSDSGSVISYVPETETVKVQEQNTFQSELNNLLVDTITSKALASLLSKHRSVSDEVEGIIHSKRMGGLSDLLDSEIHKAMDKRRQEIRACFVGGTVRYEKIPTWARSYVKEYIKDMVHGLVMLTDDGE